LEQRLRIEEIRNDEWFQKNYEPIKEIESEEVNLDDVNAAFDDPEVYAFTSYSFGREYCILGIICSVPKYHHLVPLIPWQNVSLANPTHKRKAM
jgi:hypothetical protein